MMIVDTTLAIRAHRTREAVIFTVTVYWRYQMTRRLLRHDVSLAATSLSVTENESTLTVAAKHWLRFEHETIFTVTARMADSPTLTLAITRRHQHWRRWQRRCDYDVTDSGTKRWFTQTASRFPSPPRALLTDTIMVRL